MIQTINWEIGYYKDAISVIENVVYAHDAERKWIQNHPVVLYECYILNHIFQHLNNQLNTQESKLFSYDSLTVDGHALKGDIKVSLLCDDDIIYLMKNVDSCKSELALEYFDRSKRRHPIWKSEAEYTALITHVIGGNADSMDALEHAMNVVATYLTKTTDTWAVNDETVEKLEQELQELYEQGRKKFYYLFYRRQNDSEEIDKAELCRRLAGQFAKPGTKKRVRHR